jgi:hypothetical protein
MENLLILNNINVSFIEKLSNVNYQVCERLIRDYTDSLSDLLERVNNKGNINCYKCLK